MSAISELRERKVSRTLLITAAVMRKTQVSEKVKRSLLLARVSVMAKRKGLIIYKNRLEISKSEKAMGQVSVMTKRRYIIMQLREPIDDVK